MSNFMCPVCGKPSHLGRACNTSIVRETLTWYRMVVAAFSHGGGDGPSRDLVNDHGKRAEDALLDLDDEREDWRFQIERMHHDETRGYRQKAEQEVAETKALLDKAMDALAEEVHWHGETKKKLAAFVAWHEQEKKLREAADAVAKMLQARVDRFDALLHPCKGGCLRKATHAREDVIFGVGNAELCEECAKRHAIETGETWILKEGAVT